MRIRGLALGGGYGEGEGLARIMKPCLATALLFVALMVQNESVHAQGVYVTRGEKGPVFSDKPLPGGKEVVLKPLNVMTPVPAADKAASPATVKARDVVTKNDSLAEAYRDFSVVFPENGGSVMANTAVFEVRLAVDPPLQLGEQHAFSVSINGRPVDQRFTSTEFMIPPEFWGDRLPPENQSVQLDASIVDANGSVLKKAAAVRFVMRYAMLLDKPQRPFPKPRPLPKVRSPKPEQQPAVGAAMRRSVTP